MATYTSLSFGFTSTEIETSTTSDAPDESLTSSEGLSIVVEIGSEPEADTESGVTALAQGSATAVGTDTLATGELVATAELGTAYDTAYAEASFLAIGVGDTDSQVFATAEAYADITGSFDIVISQSSYESTIATVDDTTVWLEAQSTSVTGIDIGGSLSTDSEAASLTTPEVESTGDEVLLSDGSGISSEDASLEVELLSSELETDLSGNTADLAVFVEASGPDTFTDASISLLTVEDQLSTVDGIVIAAVSL